MATPPILPDSGIPNAGPPPIPGKPVSFWKSQIELAVKERRRHETWWEANLKAYAPAPDQLPDTYASHINTNRDFTLVERKKADLFYQRPDVTLQPTPLVEQPIPTGQMQIDPQTGQPAPVTVSALPALQSHQEILNEKLGPDGIDAVSMAHRAIFDVLCPAGIGFTLMGYEAVSQPVEDLDPVTGQPTVIDVPIHEQCYWEHFSAKQAIIPHDFRSTQWDRAPFLGREFTLPLTPTNRRRFKLPDDYQGSRPKDEQVFDHGSPTAEEGRGVFTGCEIWYKSSLFRDDILHPEHLTHLVMVDGIDEPVIHEDCPYQTLDDRGQLTPDSLRGFPVHPLTVRVLSDSAYPPSDCTLIRPLVNELNVFREQMVQYRDAMTLQWYYNTDTLPPEAIEKFKRREIGGMIGVPADAFAGEGPFKEIPRGSMPRESFTSNDYIDNDIARTTAIDASGAGVQSTGDTTATEQQIIAANANARLDFERGRVLQWYIKGVTKYSTLIQRYFSVEDAAAIVGLQRAQFWDQWRRTVPSTLAFTALPDSALRVDQAVDRRQAQELYTYLAQDPNVNRPKLLEGLLRKFHLDPSQIMRQPPPPSPQLPSTSFAFTGDDLSSPAAPVVMELLQQLGFKISATAVQQMLGLVAQQAQMEADKAASETSSETPHGGKVAPMESLDKHQSDRGLGMQGIGGVATGGGGAAQ